MVRILFPVVLAVAGAGLAYGQQQPEKKFEDFDKVTKGAKEYEGLFRLHHKDEHLYAELLPQQLDKPFLCPIAIARGMGLGGFTLNFDEQWVLVFKRVGDKVHLVRRNVRYQAKKDSPVAVAVETTYTDSVLMALKIHSIHPQRQSVLIDLNDIFMTDFAQLRLGSFDAGRSTWFKIKSFPRNVELEVAAVFSGRDFGLDDSVIDSRGQTVVMHYGLTPLPEDGYQPRYADDRVGYFLSAVKDYSTDSRDTAFVRRVNRWRLERADNDPKNKDRLSAPKKKIVFWIEKSVPDEYRAFVREGILEWNKAFEKIGFRDAIEVRQQENEDFDPEDVNYNTFRWVANGGAFAMGPSRANPLTGEILDADIIFDADMIRFFKREYRVFTPSGQAAVLQEPLGLSMATREAWGLPQFRAPSTQYAVPSTQSEENGGWNDRLPLSTQHAAFGAGEALRTPLWAVRQGVCQCCAFKRHELALGAMVAAAREPGGKVPDEMIGQAIKEIVMHEVGHTLGLRHNFKASTMLKNEQLHDTAVTRKTGLGSVMDYAPVNLAPKGVKQGDYFTTTIGPYDYWAIEYAYRPLSGGPDGELEELGKIAARGAAPGHDYGTDEDLFTTEDPLVNAWDLGNDPMKFALDRMLLAEEMMKGLADRVVEKGEGYQRARQSFGMLLGQYANAAFLMSRYVGGAHVHRDHRGDPDGRDPFVPVPAARQREALKLLSDNLLTDKPFQFPPELLRKLAADRWWHWGNESMIFSSVDVPLYEMILRIQRIALLNLLRAETLARIQNNALKANGDEPLQVADIFRSLTDGIWADVSPKAAKPANPVVRRNLQREHLKQLGELVLSSRVPPDARSLARFHLRDIDRRIDAVLNDKKLTLDDTARAHLEECHERIGKVLSAGLQVREP